MILASFVLTNQVQLKGAMDSLKKANRGRNLLSNYYLSPLDDAQNLRLIQSERSLCFMVDEWGFSRAYFLTYDLQDLKHVLLPIDWTPIAIIDWISRKEDEQVNKILLDLGFHIHAVYDRIICSDLRNASTNERLSYATEKEAENIHALFFKVFDKYGDHILGIAELVELIKKKQMIISRDPNGDIQGFVLYRIENNKCNFNFLYHSGSPLDLSYLLGNFYGVLKEKNVHFGFGWIRRTRSTVLKLHQSFGWKKDGLIDFIYLR